MKKNMFFFCVAFLTILIGGCAKEAKVVQEASPLTTVPAGPKAIVEEIGSLRQEKLSVGNSVNGKPIDRIVISKKDGANEHVVLIIASLMGNEPAGTPILGKLIEHIKTHPEILNNRKIVLLPRVNPDGVESDIRENANKVDLNRDFPSISGNKGELQPETKAVVETIEAYNPERIIGIRQLGNIDLDYPKEKKEESYAITRYLKKYCQNLNFKDDATRPGSLGQYSGEVLKTMYVSFGLPKGADKMGEQYLWEQYGDALISLITYPDDIREGLLIKRESAGIETYDSEQGETDDKNACYKEAKALFRQGNYSAAKDKFGECKKCKKCQAYINAAKAFEDGVSLYEVTDCERAISEFNKVLKLNPKDRQVKEYIASCKKESDTPPPTSAKPAVKKNTIEEKDLSDSKPQPPEQVKPDPNLQLIGKELFKKGDYAGAKDRFEKAGGCAECAEYLSKSEKANTAFNSGLQAFNAKDYKKAAAQFQEVIRLNPDDQKAKKYLSESEIYNQGQTHFAEGESLLDKDPVAAKAAFNKAAQSDSKCTKCRDMIRKCNDKIYDKGKGLFLNKKYDEAISVFKQLTSDYKHSSCQDECKTAGEIITLSGKLKEKIDKK